MAEQPGKRHILKVENNPHTLDILGDALVGRGYRITRIRSCERAYKVMQNDRPDVILIVHSVAREVDARYWLRCQHTHPDGEIAMLPALILAEQRDLPDIMVEAMPGRVEVRALPINLRQLDHTLRQLIWPWGKLCPE